MTSACTAWTGNFLFSRSCLRLTWFTPKPLKKEPPVRALLGSGTLDLTYHAATDPDGSVNTTSLGGKTDFWDYANALFGLSLNAGEGLTGLTMPQDHPTNPGAQDMAYHSGPQWFSAEGIPITPIEDDLQINTYPLMRIRALNADTGASLGRLDIVVPVAMETDCQSCHFTGGVGSLRGGIVWAVDAVTEVTTKKNILLLHDFLEGTTLDSQTQVQCSGCHYSLALDSSGSGPNGDQLGKPSFSNVMHEYHGNVIDQNGDPAYPPGAGVDDTCYRCNLMSRHPVPAASHENCLDGVHPLPRGHDRRGRRESSSGQRP